METEVLCGLGRLCGTPVFVLPTANQELKRVFGATFFPKEGVWRFPAFFPYCEDVVRDLQIVAPELKFTDLAQRHIQTAGQLDVDVSAYRFLTEPYAHQRDGLEWILKNLRCGLFYDMGLGKTKIVADGIRILKLKTLVLAPTVGIGTWLAEIERHASDLNAVALTGGGEAGKKAAKAVSEQKKKLKAALKLATTDRERELLTAQIADLLGPAKAAKRADIQEAAKADVIVVSYDTAKLYQEFILNTLPYEMIVADESHNMRGPTTDRTKAAIALASKAGRRVILSGTPSLGNPLHLYGQLSFLGKYVPAKDQWTFRRHYMIHAKGQRKILLGFKNLDVLHDKVARICTRKKKEECLDLPERTIVDVPYTLSPEQKEMYNDIVEGTLVELEDGTLYEPNHAAVALQKLLQILSGFMIKPAPPVCDECEKLLVCAPAKIKPFTPACPKYPAPNPQEIHRMKTNAKLDALEELLDGILAEERNKVIIWGYFLEELNLVQGLLERKGWKHIRVDGSNSSKGQTFAAEFNQNPAVRVWLAQVGTGVALTLTASAYMVYFGLTFRLDDYLQSLDRNYRIGQKASTFVYRLVVPNSVAAFVVRALEAKFDVAEILTVRIDCMLCPKSEDCVVQGIKPFELGCVYKSRVKRQIIRPSKL